MSPCIVAIQYLCDGTDEHVMTSSYSVQTNNVYPQTIVPSNSDIPITLGVHNYLYKDSSQDPGLIYHEIDVNVLDTYFDSLYIAFPSVVNSSTSTIFQSRYRDNLGSLFRIRYATDSSASCVASNLIQFKMIFLDNDTFYEYYFGNCNTTEVFYDSFNNDSLCIPMNFTCFHNNYCDQASYDLAHIQASKNHIDVFNDDDISVSGYYPLTSISCLDNQTCDFDKYTTGRFNFSLVSYTPVQIATTVSQIKPDSVQTFASLLTTSLTPTKNIGHSSNPQSFTSLILFLLYFLGY